MEAEEFLVKRIKELAEKSYQQYTYLHTNFLSLAEQSLVYGMEWELSYANPVFAGGHPFAERKLVMFGSKELFGYDAKPPISCIHISPLAPKYSDTLSHRDYLGAIMNLGIEREYLGDILIDEMDAYVFCVSSMADYLAGEITKIKHTLVMTEIVDPGELTIKPKVKQVEGFVSSFRLDAIVALGFNLSRNHAQTAVSQKKVFIDGRLAEFPSKQVTEGNLISVRGLGKMRFAEIRGMSKKGRHSVRIEKFV